MLACMSAVRCSEFNCHPGILGLRLCLLLTSCSVSHLQHPSSTTPPIDIAPSRLKLMRRGPDRKSEFLRALKDEGTGELTTSSSPGTSGEVG